MNLFAVDKNFKPDAAHSHALRELITHKSSVPELSLSIYIYQWVIYRNLTGIFKKMDNDC